MADQRKYDSAYGGGQITAAQFLAEFMVARLARVKGVRLPLKFWNLPAWKRTYRLQLLHAYSVLKLYSPEAVSRALRSPEGKKAFSLNAPWLDALFQAEQQKDMELVAVCPTTSETSLPANLPSAPRPAFIPKASVLSKLRGLDG